ncbi:MAG: aminotransferase class I/II-fold pyridoxal phosphate-dependent enzyme [Acidobacteria bacterium]|nr:aminotransferase class I/II-fold pyridoxal phosphate-dependent enzyme [Acidobacteriota bacterium]
MTRAMHSPYMHWAKTRFRTAPRFGLTNSGVYNFPISELKVSLDDLELSGPSYYGFPTLQTALAAHTGAPPECIVAATGTSMANYLAMAAVLSPGDDCLIESPAYDPMVCAASHLGARVLRFARPPENGFPLDVEEVRRNVTRQTRLIVITNLHNPSSALISSETLRALAALAREANARVLVDEVYLATALAHPAPVTSFLLDSSTFIVTNSLTKAYGLSGLRCGWILADADLAARIWRLNDLFGVIPAHAAERLSCLALAQMPAISARANQLLTANRKLIHGFLQARHEFSGGITAFGTVAFPRLDLSSCGISVDSFCDTLYSQYETSIVPGSFFDAPDHVRIGYGCPTEMLIGGLDRIATALDSLAQ